MKEIDATLKCNVNKICIFKMNVVTVNVIDYSKEHTALVNGVELYVLECVCIIYVDFFYSFDDSFCIADLFLGIFCIMYADLSFFHLFIRAAGFRYYASLYDLRWSFIHSLVY